MTYRVLPLRKKPLKDVPNNTFERRGYGLADLEHWHDRIQSAQYVQNIIKTRRIPENLPEGLLELHHHFHAVKRMFWHIYVGDTRDWYSISNFLGHPSAKLCLRLTRDLDALKGAVRSGNLQLMNNVIDQIEQKFGDEMLDNFLQLTLHREHPVREEGWAYILWSSSERDVLHIGAAAGQVEEVIRRLNKETPGSHPYGVLSAWLVGDPVVANEDIHQALGDCHLGNGFFRINFPVARERVTTQLQDKQNFALSPWHGCQGIKSKPNVPDLKLVG
ncbi:hypothetical protein HFN89_03305 [Rhizobium laguerreae]|nr:hypothetical protein [Rhizobium laguerreae]